MSYAGQYDYHELLSWLKDPNRKDPALAFSSGCGRVAATAVVESGLLAEIDELKRELGRVRRLAKEFANKVQE